MHGGWGEQPITGLIIFLLPLSWQQLPRLLPNLCFTNTWILGVPTSQGEASPSQSSYEASQHRGRAPEVNSVNFKAALPLSSSSPSNWIEGRWWCQPLGMAPEDDTWVINTFALAPITAPKEVRRHLQGLFVLVVRAPRSGLAWSGGCVGLTAERSWR